MKFKHSNCSQAFKLKKKMEVLKHFETLCVLLTFSCNKQSQQPLSKQKWLKHQLIHLKERLHLVNIMSTRVIKNHLIFANM